ncbi:MAG: hypothetical protein ACJ71N_11320 [Terriglobales bacterium]
MLRAVFCVVFICILANASLLSAQESDHVVKANRIISRANPPITIKVDKRLRYVGKIDFPLKGIARVERFIFVEPDTGQHVRRMFVAQFEGFLPNNNEIYRYKVKTPVVLGGTEYQHNTLFYDDAATGSEEPEAESAKTRAFVTANGYALEKQLMMSRFARVVDEAKRHELILFYFENLSASGNDLATLSRNDQDNPEAKAAAEALLKRALKAFKVRPLPAEKR